MVSFQADCNWQSSSTSGKKVPATRRILNHNGTKPVEKKKCTIVVIKHYKIQTPRRRRRQSENTPTTAIKLPTNAKQTVQQKQARHIHFNRQIKNIKVTSCSLWKQMLLKERTHHDGEIEKTQTSRCDSCVTLFSGSLTKINNIK